MDGPVLQPVAKKFKFRSNDVCYVLTSLPKPLETADVRMAKQHAPRFLALVESVRPHIRECSIAELKQRLDAKESLHLIDVREESEFAAGHIPGAIHLGKGIIERDIEGAIADTHAPILLYCGGGFRSALAAANLAKMGYTNVTSVDGGWRGWTEAGYPITK